MQLGKYLTRKEAADYTGFSQQTLAKWAMARKGPRFHKYGAGKTCRVRYSIVDLDAFLEGSSQPEKAA
jgi:excisionase family DNA binding protein